jgi:8-oxo-dGTP diphosphatase
VGISVQRAAPLIRIRHDYGDRDVLLDVWAVELFSGAVKAAEGQPLRWVVPERLDAAVFPAANRPIITAAKLPRHYAILEGCTFDALLDDFYRIVRRGVKLLQFRLKGMTQTERRVFLMKTLPLCRRYGITALANSSIVEMHHFAVGGIHLTVKDLLALGKRPAEYAWVAASCHNLQELRHAQRIGVDFAVLAPVAATKTHPGIEPLGWRTFSVWVDEVNIPVFALGGMAADDAGRAYVAGAQGIAGIRLFRD